MRRARWSIRAAMVLLAAGAVAVAPAAQAAPDLDDGRRAWVVGERVVAFGGCWSTGSQPLLLEARTRQGWVTLDRATVVRDPDQCPRAAYPWAASFAFRLDQPGVRGVPGSAARLLQLRTRGQQAGSAYVTDKLVYPTRAACRSELRAWQCA